MKRYLSSRWCAYPILVTAVFLLFSCGERPSPRKIVMEFVEAVYASDSTTILKHVDFEQVAREKLKYLPEEVQLKNLDLMQQQLFRSLIGNGSVRAKWNSYRIVVADEAVQGDSAWVDVTFMHLQTGITSLTQTILNWKKDSWKIVSYAE